MKYVIEYYTIQSDHILAIPQFSHKEIVDSTLPKIGKYLRGKGYSLAKASTKKAFGFDFTDNWGAVKVKKYVAPRIKKI